MHQQRKIGVLEGQVQNAEDRVSKLQFFCCFSTGSPQAPLLVQIWNSNLKKKRDCR